MNVFSFIIWVVALAFVFTLLRTWIQGRNERGAVAADEATLARLEELEERVRVLERIVTEKRTDLREEIDRL